MRQYNVKRVEEENELQREMKIIGVLDWHKIFKIFKEAKYNAMSQDWERVRLRQGYSQCKRRLGVQKKLGAVMYSTSTWKQL